MIGCLGVLLYFLAVRPFAGKPGMSWVMSTIGFGIILTSLGLAIWGPSRSSCRRRWVTTLSELLASASGHRRSSCSSSP